MIFNQRGLNIQYLKVAGFEPYAFFDRNGIIVNPHSVIFEGDRAKSRMAELLPVDYEPEKANGK